MREVGKSIALIPARGGSKGLPGKNLRLLGNRPLVTWSIECAQKVNEIERVYVSTDDEEIAKCASENNALIHDRPSWLSQDVSLVKDLIVYFWKQVLIEIPDAEFLILLEPTSPFRTAELIRKCLLRVQNEDFDSFATFARSKLVPNRLWDLDGVLPKPFLADVNPWLPRQKQKEAHVLDGRIYILRPSKMPLETSSILFGKIGCEIVDGHYVDIDTALDLEVANALVSKFPEQFDL